MLSQAMIINKIRILLKTSLSQKRKDLPSGKEYIDDRSTNSSQPYKRRKLNSVESIYTEERIQCCGMQKLIGKYRMTPLPFKKQFAQVWMEK